MGLMACSDGRTAADPVVQNVIDRLADWGIRATCGRTLYRQGHTPFSGSPQARAQQLMDFFTDDRIAAIFDISGGDSANQILPYLDYDVIRDHPKPFVGMSDVSVILNAIYARSSVPTFHYQIASLAGTDASAQRARFEQVFLDDRRDYTKFLTFGYAWLQGHEMTGSVVGGNIRCFLKLAGTPYLPDPQGKILFLESLGGGPNRMASLLAQLRQMDYLAQCRGVLLGTFTQMTAQHLDPTMEELVLDVMHDYPIPIAVSPDLGHEGNAHCLPIGAPVSFQ